MKNAISCLALIVGFLVMPFSAVAAEQADYDALAEKIITSMGKLAGLLEGVEGDASADAAVADIRKLTKDELVPLYKAMDALGEPSQEVGMAMQQKFAPKMQAVTERISAAMIGIEQEHPDQLGKMQDAMDEFGRAMEPEASSEPQPTAETEAPVEEAEAAE